MPRLRVAATLAFALTCALAAGSSNLLAAPLVDCTNGRCSGYRPAYTDTAWVSWVGHRIAVGTQQPETPADYCVTLYDLDTGIPPLDTNWDPAAGLMRRYHGPLDGSGFGDWRGDTLGSVFGLTLDDLGNIFVTYTSIYSGDLISLLPGATSGTVFKIDRITGFVSVFANLPQQYDVVVGTNYGVSEGWPGLGNITFDPVHQYLFVTNMEDGKIYRLNMSGTITATFDPMGPDNGAAGWAPLGERLWGIQWHADNRLYYGVWKTQFSLSGSGAYNTIRSVSLDGSGNILSGTDQQEIQIPHLSPGTYSQPVSDLSFSPSGHLFLAEHGVTNETLPHAHDARVLEYACEVDVWAPSGNTYLVGIGTGQNAAGGVDVDYSTYVGGVPGRVWASGDALHVNFLDSVYGAQGLPPTGGGLPQSYIFDYNGSVVIPDKSELGDIEIPCPPATGSVRGSKFQDLDCDGEFDLGEPGLPGWTIVLSGTGGTFTTTTDASGNFSFSNVPNGNYTVCELGQAGWTQTAPGSGCHTISVSGGVVSGLRFGNCSSCPTPATCVKAPPNMMAWWPLDEPAGALAHDLAGFNPGTWIGGPTAGAGRRGGALCFAGPAAYVRVSDGSQINFGSTADFSIDAWIKPSTVSGASMILDKRVPVGANFRGYALGLQGASLVFMIQDGTNAAVAYTSGAVIVPNQWQHVAVTVKRSLNGGTAYLNGAPIGTFDPLATGAGSVTNASPLYIGRDLSGTIGFTGCLDEVELFCRELSGAEVMSLWSPGKCREWCSPPPVVNFGPTQTSVSATFTICNNDWSQPSMTYMWSLSGLAAGSCSVNGPTVYTPSTGVLVVPAGGCQTVNVSITRPSWLTPGNTGCYVFNVRNTTTQACFHCTGVVRAHPKFWGHAEVDSIVIGPSGTGILSFTLHDDDAPGVPSDISVRVAATHGDEGGSAPPLVRLNGLPPGEPWIGTMSLVGGGVVVIGVPIEWGGPCSWSRIPDTFVELSVEEAVGLAPSDLASARLLLGDPDGSGAAVASAESGVEGVAAWPNPTSGEARVRLSLARVRQVEVGVYDLAGRRLRLLHRGGLEPGTHDLHWDGRDDGGRPARAGLYFIRMRADDRAFRATLVRVN